MARLTGPRQPQVRGTRPRKLVVLLHGYGADGNDLIGLAPYLQRAMPDVAFVAPNGPEACGMSPMGRQWFAIDIDDPARMSRDPHMAVRRFAAMGARADGVMPLVNAFLDEELARAGLTDADLALVGFSQGTMLSLHTGLRRPAPPAGIVGFSGALLGGETIHQVIRHPVPVTLIHGDADDLVPPLAMYDAVGALGRAGLPVQFHVSPGTGHSIAMDGIDLAARFLVDAFAGRWAVHPPISSAL